MADQTRQQREIEAIRRQYAAIDFGAMKPFGVRACFLGDAPIHKLTSDPAEFVRTSPYCTDLTDKQRMDVIAKLRQYLRDKATSSERGGIIARIQICADYLGRRVPHLREAVTKRRLPHAFLLHEIRGMRNILERMEREVLNDGVLPTDRDGVEWVEVTTPLKSNHTDYEITARVYLEDGDDDSDIVDAKIYALDDDGDYESQSDPDEELNASARDLWRDAVRKAAAEQACELGLGCEECGEINACCICRPADEKEAAHA